MLDEWADYARKMHEFQKGVVEHVEMLAAAYMKATDIPPEECELVVETLPDKMVYRFQRRPTPREPDDGDAPAESELSNDELDTDYQLWSNM